MKEELGTEDEAGVSSRAFVLYFRVGFLVGLFPKAILGGILEERDFWQGLGESLEGRNERGFSLKSLVDTKEKIFKVSVKRMSA